MSKNPDHNAINLVNEEESHEKNDSINERRNDRFNFGINK